MKKVLIFLVVICVMVGLVACSKKEEPSTETPIENTQETPVDNSQETSEVEIQEEASGASFSQFSLFSTTIAGLADTVMSDATPIKVQTMINGTAITDAQIYNLLARKLGVEDETAWISAEEAEKAITPFEGEEGKISVITADNQENVASCYITGKGNVFCWPPIVYQGKSYVNSKTVLQDASGNDITDLSAGTFVVNFGGLGLEATTETLQITANADGTYEMAIQ